MVKCNRDQVGRLKKALKREKDPVVRQRIQMVLLREDGKTQPQIAELTSASLSTINRAHMAYENGGVNALKPKPCGGRIRENRVKDRKHAAQNPLAAYLFVRVLHGESDMTLQE